MFRCCFVIAVALHSLLASAASEKEQLFVDSLKSVVQVREKLRSLVAENRECGSGSCWTATGYEICYYIGGLDRQLDYQISNGSNDRKPKPKMEISPSDLKNLQLMFSQCRLRDFPSLLQVVYVPTKRFEKRINSWLDVEK